MNSLKENHKKDDRLMLKSKQRSRSKKHNLHT